MSKNLKNNIEVFNGIFCLLSPELGHWSDHSNF